MSDLAVGMEDDKEFLTIGQKSNMDEVRSADDNRLKLPNYAVVTRINMIHYNLTNVSSIMIIFMCKKVPFLSKISHNYWKILGVIVRAKPPLLFDICNQSVSV